MKPTKILAACLSLCSVPAFAGITFISKVYVQAQPSCPSGFMMTIRPPDYVESYCIEETKSFQSAPWKDLEVKVAWKLTKYPNRKKGMMGRAKVVMRDPPQEIGTQIENAGFLGVVAGVATAYNESHGIASPPTTDSPSSPQTQSGGGTYVPGLNNCANSYFDKDYYNFLTYKNQCTQKITIRWLNQNGNGGAADIEPGMKAATGDTPENLNKIGRYDTYVCPYHYIAIDLNGQQFLRPVTAFKCVSAGY